jgi:putative endopeptidase
MLSCCVFYFVACSKNKEKKASHNRNRFSHCGQVDFFKYVNGKWYDSVPVIIRSGRLYVYELPTKKMRLRHLDSVSQGKNVVGLKGR